jgi:peptidoglycan/LPS O-acetylase OafA/YrhL
MGGVADLRLLDENGAVKYRPDIDGLRAVAVIAVVAFHAFPSLAQGGFVGVDVFFVISGYLISGIILGALEQDRFSFAGFYARRIRRIFPALAIVLAACYAWGWFVLFAEDYKQLSRHIAGGVAFVSNFILWDESGYFDDAGDTKPLQHLWSLGIEEQFYLAWPTLLVLAWRARVHPLGPTALLLVASFLLNVKEIRWDLVGTFYSPFTRLWELLMGAVLSAAAVSRSGWPTRSLLMIEAFTAGRPYIREIGAALGLVLIAAAVGVIDGGRLFPGLWALLPTVGAFAIIAAGPATWVTRRALSQPWLVWVGLISYPLYLWHWPLLSFARIIEGETPSVVVRIAAVAVSVILAALTYELVEKPIRHGPRRRFTIAALSTSMVAVLATALVTYRADGLFERPINRTDQAHFVQYYDWMHKNGIEAAYRRECDFMDWPTGHTRESIDPACTVRGERRTLLLWGDSFAQSMSLGIRAILPAQDALAQVATSMCRPSLEDLDSHVPERRCQRANQFAIDSIAKLRPDVVILAQKGGYEQTDWKAMTERLVALGAGRVVLVGPAPRWRPSLPEVVATHYWGTDFRRVSYGLQNDVEVDARLQADLQAVPHLTYVSMLQSLCNADGCLAVVPGSTNNDLIAFDFSHLSLKGSVFVADTQLRRYLQPLD